MHERQHVTVGEQELVVDLIEADPLHAFISAEPLVHLGAVANVLELYLRKGAALAGLNLLQLDRTHQSALVLDDIAGADGVTVDFHDYNPC